MQVCICAQYFLDCVRTWLNGRSIFVQNTLGFTIFKAVDSTSTNEQLALRLQMWGLDLSGLAWSVDWPKGWRHRGHGLPSKNFNELICCWIFDFLDFLQWVFNGLYFNGFSTDVLDSDYQLKKRPRSWGKNSNKFWKTSSFLDTSNQICALTNSIHRSIDAIFVWPSLLTTRNATDDGLTLAYHHVVMGQY